MVVVLQSMQRFDLTPHVSTFCSAKAKATSGAAVVQRITPPNAVVAMEEKDVKGLDFVVTREPTTYTLTGEQALLLVCGTPS